MNGIVYVLSNPAIPNMVKIGSTSQDDVSTRMNQLYSTGVPVPFECEIAVRVADETGVEQALHTAFINQRVNEKREFFEVEPFQVEAILKLLETTDAKPAVADGGDETDEISEEAGKRLKNKRRPNLNFREMGIPEGSVLKCVKTDDTAVVIDEKNVEFRDEKVSLTFATMSALNSESPVGPTYQWTYDGRLLRDIYNETYS